MSSWLSLFRNAFNEKSKVDRTLYSSLNLDRFIERCLQILSDISGAEKVFWINVEEYERMCLHHKGQRFEEGQKLTSKHRVYSSDKIVNTKQMLSWLEGLEISSDSLSVMEGRCLVPHRANDSETVLGYWLFVGISERHLQKKYKDITRLTRETAQHLEFCLEHQAALDEALKDDLTGLYNQKYMAICMENEINRSDREKKKFSVLFMDIDYFKSVNDSRGHWIGSRMLVELGKILGNNTRRSDYCFRYGGDEFVILLSDTDQEGAQVAAERIRKTVENTPFIVDGLEFRITLSIGIATYPDHAKTYRDIVRMADEAMYCGKNKSRNIVYLAS